MTMAAEAAELPPRHGHLASMALGALGVVYGDIGMGVPGFGHRGNLYRVRAPRATIAPI